MTQRITSARTSVCQVPSLHRKVRWKRGQVNLDVGGGECDKASAQLARRGVRNLVYDPYNRDRAHNAFVLARKGDTATLANVLNVIREPAERRKALEKAKQGVKPCGVVYISVHEGDRSGRGRKTPRGWQANRVTSSYLAEVRAVLPSAERRGRVIVAKLSCRR